MKINWGTGIFLFYSFFAITLFYQVYQSTKYDRSLVVDNYYEEDLAYQKTYNKLSNAQSLAEPLTMNFYEGLALVELQFPKHLSFVEGTVLLYYPSTNKEDLLLPIRVDCENVMDIFVRELPYGKWKIEVDWTAENTQYLNRFTLHIPKLDGKLLTIK